MWESIKKGFVKKEEPWLDPAFDDATITEAEKRISAGFLSSIEGALETADESIFERAATTTAPEAAAEQLVLDLFGAVQAGERAYQLDLFGGGWQPLQRSIRAVATTGAKQTVPVIERATKITFDLTPATSTLESGVNSETASLVREIDNTTRDGIASVIRQGLRDGVNPRETARQIRDLIGLTERQARAIESYRAALVRGDAANALGRALRDKRFDPTVSRMLSGDLKPTPEQIDKYVTRYKEKMLSYRAETISRTESLNALHVGQRAAWDNSIEQGKVKKAQIRRQWIVGKDERTCDICMVIPGMNPDGAGWEEDFETPVGPVYMPTIHPDCRCSLWIWLESFGAE